MRVKTDMGTFIGVLWRCIKSKKKHFARIPVGFGQKELKIVRVPLFHEIKRIGGAMVFLPYKVGYASCFQVADKFIIILSSDLRKI